MLKTLCYSYLGDLDDRRGGRVVYAVQGGNVVIFSGTTQKTSTINAAEDIIRQICAAENLCPSSVRFFDLQTYLGYSHKEPGHFEYDEVIVDENCKPGWMPTACPQDVIELFRLCIGGYEIVQVNLA